MGENLVKWKCIDCVAKPCYLLCDDGFVPLNCPMDEDEIKWEKI